MGNDITYLFDFDGVLCNSIDECMLTSYNAFNHTNLINTKDVPNQFKSYFYKYRYHVGPAEEYFLICKAFSEKKHLSFAVFTKMKEELRDDMNNFEYEFFETRRFLKNQVDLWFSYHTMYNHVAKFIGELTQKFFVVTTKDYDSVKLLANHFGFINKIEEIASKEISIDKSVLFDHLFDKYKSKLKDRRIIFVDDNEFHLESLKTHPVELYFAKWGYAKKQIYNSFDEINTLNELT